MCYFLTVAVPAKYIDIIGEVFGQGFHIHPTANPSVTAALPVGYEARLVTSGMCSCDLYARPMTDAVANRTAHLRRKYQKLGWSEAKIRRATEQTEANASKSNLPMVGFRDDVTQGLGALCRAAGSVAFFVHSYDGDVETEPLSLNRTKPCDCAELSSRARQLDEDEVLIAKVR